MTINWVGLRAGPEMEYSRAGLGQASGAASDPNAILHRGTLMVECDVRPGLQGEVLLTYFADRPWQSGLTLSLDAQGTLIMTQRQGAARRRFVLDTGLSGHASAVTITYTWDAHLAEAYLSAEIVQSRRIVHCRCADPLPLTLRDTVRMVMDRRSCQVAAGMSYLAIADSVVPHGPKPSLLPGTLIPTPEGHRPAGELRPGQLVVAADGAVSQLRWVGKMRLPSRGRHAPVRLRAPLHGATDDLICARDQRLQFLGSEVEYLFATDAVSAAVGDLPAAVRAPDPQATRCYVQFLLDRPVPVRSGGLLIEGFDAAQLLQDGELRRRSVLADLPEALMPRLDGGAPKLRDFETKSLGQMKVA